MPVLRLTDTCGGTVRALPSEDGSACTTYVGELVELVLVPDATRTLGSRTFDALVWIGGHLS